jgi:hypothetical protein
VVKNQFFERVRGRRPCTRKARAERAKIVRKRRVKGREGR